METLLEKYSGYLKDEKNENSTRIIREALQSHVDVVTLLVEGGADVNLKDKDNNSALDFDYKPPSIESIDSAQIGVEGTITPDL